MQEIINMLHEELKGSRTINGELCIEGMEEEEYEELYFELLDILKDGFNGNYSYWYSQKVKSYARFKYSQSKNPYYKCWHIEKHTDFHTIREQLVILKHHIYRKKYSYKKGEK